MYNQYLDDSEFILLEPETQGQPSAQDRSGAAYQNQNRQPHPGQGQNRPSAPLLPHLQGPGKSKNDLVGEVTGGLSQLLDGVLKHFSLKNFDTGDILLVLIILFLYLEGDNLELVITLGLLLLLGLGDDDKET